MWWISLLLFTVLPYKADLQYTKDGDFLVGGIISGIGQCPGLSEVNSESITVVEAINFAISQIETDAEFTHLTKTSRIGYDLRDGCGSFDKEKDIAYAFNMDKRKARGDASSAHNFVSLVISEFGPKSVDAVKVLSIESTLQLSYSPNNIRLKQDSTVPDADISLLASVYPSDANKMAAIVDVIRALHFEHVYLVGSDDSHGRSGLQVLKRLLDAQGVCSSSEMTVWDEQSANSTIREILKNKHIRVVVLHGNGETESLVFKLATLNNVTDLVFITTNELKLWRLQPYLEVAEGMISVAYRIKPSRSYETHVDGLRRPYSRKPWLEKLYTSLGGTTKICYDPALVKNDTTKHCFDAEDQLKLKLAEHKETAVYVIDAIYSIAHALKNKGNATLVSSLMKTQFTSPLTNNMVDYANSMVANAQNFELENIQANTSASVVTKWVGEWSKSSTPRLKLNKQHLRWKGGRIHVPTSRWNDECPLGTKAVHLNPCAWFCERCPNGTISNSTNSKACVLCEKGHAPSPNQSTCAQYKIKYFHWFNTLGQVMIFIIVLGICITLFCLGILSQNSEHQVVKVATYKLLFVYLAGLIFLFLAPIPLLVEPTVKSCSAFIGLFNIGMTIPIAVLMSKTSIITDHYYDEEGDVIKGSLGKSPRALVFVVTVASEVLILLVGLFAYPPAVKHNPTELWDVRYAECANYESFTFWVAFSFNMALAFICNALSCTAKDMEKNFGELKDIIKTTLLFFAGCFALISIIYSTQNQGLAQGQAVMCIVIGFLLISTFILPKVFVILFKTKADGKTVDNENLLKADEARKTTARHASDGFKHHGIIQMRIKEESDEETRA